MAHTEGSELARVSGAQKVRRSPDWSLQLDSMKSESLVNRGSECRGEYVSRALYTPPVTPWEWAAPEVDSLTFGGRFTTVVVS